ncbi:MAG TPA: SwmB domain-containing protein [Gaiellaceae bacterium]
MWKLTATDDVGNAATFSSGTMTVDPTAPSAPTLLSISPVGTGLYYSGSGATIFAKAGADSTNDFTVTAASTDADSGVASYSFPAIAGFTKNVSGATATYTVGAIPLTGGDGGSGSVTSTNGIGGTSGAGFTLTVTVDGSAPAATGFSAPGSDVYSTDGTATVSWGAFSDGGSGMSILTIARQYTTLAANACGSSWTTDNTFSHTLTTASTSIPQETGLTSGECFRYVLTADDHLGNETTFTSAGVMVDTTPPATPTLTSITASGANIATSGSTVYFKPGADNTNTFTITADSTGDPETGLKTGSWSFPSIPGFGTPVVSGNQAIYTAATPTALQGGPGYATVENNALETSAQGASFTVVVDSTAPAGGGFTSVPSYSSNGSASLGLTLFTDGGGSGLASQTLTRQKAAPTGTNTCPLSTDVSWTNDTTLTPATSVLSSGMQDGTCYQFVFTATDNVGNAATSVVGGPVLVDSSGPTTPTLSVSNPTNAYFDGTTVFFNPALGGGFTVTATSTPSASGIASYSFPALPGFTKTPVGGHPEEMTYTFNVATTDQSGNVFDTSNSGVASGGALLKASVDTTGPAAPTITCTTACSSNATVSVTLAANGDGSGSGVAQVKYTTDGSDPTTSGAAQVYSGPISVGSGTETIKAAAIDNLGNLGAVATQTVTVDGTPPADTSADVSGSTMNIHFSKALANLLPAAGSFAVKVTQAGVQHSDGVTNVSISGSTVVLTLAQAIANDQSASVTYDPASAGPDPMQDSLGNQAMGFTQSITLDTTAPSILTAVASGTTATVQFDEPLDGSSTPAATAFAFTMSPGSVANTVTNASISGSTLTLTLQNPVAGFQNASVVYAQPATNRVRDLAGNETAGFTQTVTLDTTPPHATSGEINGSTVTIHFDEALGASAPASTAFAVSLGGLSDAVTNVSISGSDATLTLTAAAVGGQSASVTYTQPGSNPRFQDAATNATPSFSLSLTNLTSGGSDVFPTLASASPADGSSQSSVAGPVVLHANEYVAWSNVQMSYVSSASDTPTTTSLPGGTTQDLSIAYATSTPGLYTITGTISDGVNTANFITHFTVWVATSPGVARPTEATGNPGQNGTLATANQQETVNWPASVVPSTQGDGLIVEMVPLAMTALNSPNGSSFMAEGSPVDITAHTILANTPVHTFSSALTITFPNAAPSDLPVDSDDNGTTWSYIQPCDDSGQIPSGMTDCYAWSNNVLTVWTMHLTLFALAGDHTPPTSPALAAGLSGGQLVLRWQPATDNTGRIQYYSIWEDGQVIQVFGGSTFEYYPGTQVDGDTHVYGIQAIDFSGNGSQLSDQVTGVPNVDGLSLQQARTLLASRGFAVGNLTNASSSGAVVSQSPAAPGYAVVGSPIDLTLGGVLRAPLAFHVVGSKRINLKTRDYAAVQVQVNLSSTIVATLALNHHTVATWTRNVKPGTWILRYTLPKRIADGQYKLTVAATTSNDRKASTIGVNIKHGRILLGGKAKVLVVAGGSPKTTIKVKVPKAKVQNTAKDNVFNTTFWSRNVAVVVVDIDRQGLAIVHNLHTVFPQVRIVAVTKDPSKLVKARRFGAAAVVLTGSGDTNQIVSATVSSLLGRV